MTPRELRNLWSGGTSKILPQSQGYSVPAEPSSTVIREPHVHCRVYSKSNPPNVYFGRTSTWPPTRCILSPHLSLGQQASADFAQVALLTFNP